MRLQVYLFALFKRERLCMNSTVYSEMTKTQLRVYCYILAKIFEVQNKMNKMQCGEEPRRVHYSADGGYRNTWSELVLVVVVVCEWNNSCDPMQSNVLQKSNCVSLKTRFWDVRYIRPMA